MPYPSNRGYNSINLGPQWAVLSGNNVSPPWLGRSTISVGSLTTTVSNANVQSTSIIAVLSVMTTTPGVGTVAWPLVNSVVHGVSFNLTRINSLAGTSEDTITWEIRPTIAP